MITNSLFREICHKSFTKTAAAFSKFISAPITIDALQLRKIKINEFVLRNSQEKIVNLYTPITGNFNGFAFFSAFEKDAYHLCDKVLNRKKNGTCELADIEISVLSETTNVLVGNYLTHFSHLLHTGVLFHKTSIIDCEKPDIIVMKAYSDLTKSLPEEAILINTILQYEEISMYLTYLFDHDSINYQILKLIA